MRLAMLSGLLLGCGPVLLGSEPADTADADAATLDVAIDVEPVGCDDCFDVEARGVGGNAPYAVTWEDGSQLAKRRVCLSEDGVDVSAVVEDARGARSSAHAISLLRNQAEATCSLPTQTLCLTNGSFEGTPVANVGQVGGLDAPPWSSCTNPAMASNTPDVLNETVESPATLPRPSDGLTYVGLVEQQQISQVLCEPMRGGTTVSVKLDLNHLVFNAAAPSTERMFLELWGGVAADCSSRELLWASPALERGWQHYCATLAIGQYADLITLRARSDGSMLEPSYLLVDSLTPVDGCP